MKHLRMRLAAMVALAVSLTTAGCGTGVGGGMTGSPVDGNRDPGATTATGGASGEPNNDFANSIVAVFDGVGRARLQGTITSPFDVDVFQLGGLTAGQRILVDVDTSDVSASLDPAIGLFDADENLVLYNDDTLGSLDSFGDLVIRHDGASYFLVISRSQLASLSRRTGGYTVDITVFDPAGIPAPQSQTFFLDFDGGMIAATNLGTQVAPAFDAGDISTMYAGETEAIKAEIVETFLENFAGLDVRVVTSDDAGSAGSATATIFFGGFHPPGVPAFGIAEGVDPYNENLGDQAAIFTEVFRPASFSFVPSVEEMGVAIGNIAAHEAGHMLGLHHVDDETALMDAESPADTFLLDQEFKRARLFGGELFSMGYQDSALLLSEIVGGTLIRTNRAGRMRGIDSLGESELIRRSDVVKCFCDWCEARERKIAALFAEIASDRVEVEGANAGFAAP